MVTRSEQSAQALLLAAVLLTFVGASCAPDTSDLRSSLSETGAEEPQSSSTTVDTLGVGDTAPSTDESPREPEASPPSLGAEPPRSSSSGTLDKRDPGVKLGAVIDVNRDGDEVLVGLDMLEWYPTREDAIAAGLDPGETAVVFIGNEEPFLQYFVVSSDVQVLIHGTSLVDEWFGAYRLSLDDWLAALEGRSGFDVAWYGIWDGRVHLPYWVRFEQGVITHLEEQYLP